MEKKEEQFFTANFPSTIEGAKNLDGEVKLFLMILLNKNSGLKEKLNENQKNILLGILPKDINLNEILQSKGLELLRDYEIKNGAAQFEIDLEPYEFLIDFFTSIGVRYGYEILNQYIKKLWWRISEEWDEDFEDFSGFF